MYLREHPQKTFNTLRGFSLFKGMVVVVVVVLEVGGKGGESVKKGKFLTKIFCPIMLNEVLKSCKK